MSPALLSALALALASYPKDHFFSEWNSYKNYFQLSFTNSSEASAAFAVFLAESHAARLAANVTCADCYKVHGGAEGDCSSVFGCNHELCDFCTNEVSCEDCYKIHQGARGSCCDVYGCDAKLCDFCTNPDSSKASCPPPSPPPPPAPTCPGGSLRACIGLCPKDDATVFEVCVENCLAKCP